MGLVMSDRVQHPDTEELELAAVLHALSDPVRLRIVRDLADSGFITTQRGIGGGFCLARPAQSITLGEVVRALDETSPLVECFRQDGGGCVLTPRCRLKGRLAAAREAFLRELDKTTLAECAYPALPRRGAA